MTAGVPEVIPTAHVALERLSDDPIVVALNVFPRFTPEEEAVLGEAVNPADVLIKPTGQVYLPHPVYIKWLNRAFGRGQWWLQQLAKPQKANNSVLIQYAFVLRGIACLSTYGEADYHENNREQTFGDVIESTHAYALRRFMKRLGVGLELWDRTFGDAWTDRYAIAVYRQGKDKPQWRRKDAPPFYDETGQGRARQREQEQPAQPRRRPQATAERPASHPKSDEPITSEQLIRFWTIARRAGRTDDEVKDFLKRHYHLESSKAMTRKDYENICKAVEHPGPLSPVVEREPGSDDQ